MPGRVEIQKWGEKMLVSGISRNKVPTEYLSISKNARIKDQTITKRRGYKTRLSVSTGTTNKGITYNKNLFVASDSKLQEVDLDAETITSLGSIGTDTIVNFVNYGKYTIVFTGLGFPYVYDGSSLTQLTSTVCQDVKPIIADKFTGFTFMVGNTDDKKNILYISRPITPTNPEYAYDWVGTNAEQVTFESDILGLKGTLNNLFIFTENRVEYIDKNSLQTIGGVATLISTPIGDGGQLATYRSVVAAGDKVFYLTKNNTINTVNYAPGTVNPQLGTITDVPVFRLTKYLNNLDSDQGNSFGYFNKTDNTMHWFLKTEGALYNDTVLIYDLTNETRTTDTKKWFNDVVVVNSKIYAGSSINSDVIEDSVGVDDDNTPIEFEIQDTDLGLGAISEKLFQGWETSGGLNNMTNLSITTYIDSKEASQVYIKGSDYVDESVASSTPGTVAGTTVSGTAIGGLLDQEQEIYMQFDKVLDHGNLYRRGKRIKRLIEENTLGSDFYLDLYTVFADATGNYELSDKF